MYYRILIYCLLLFCVPEVTCAAIFTVTSNGNTGAGTLRDALTQAAANGSATTDYIYFNLPDVTESGRTIVLQSQLPDVSANVIIDASTQPGLPFGVSDAKVCVTIIRPTAGVSAFNITASTTTTDVAEFYGLYIRGFYDGTNITGNAIYARAICKLTVGAQGKGNLISSSYIGVGGVDLRNAKIQYNIMNLAPNGAGSEPNYNSISSGGITDNLLLDHNVFATGRGSTVNLFLSSSAVNSLLSIKNNFFGTDFTGKIAVFPSTIYAGASININGPANLSVTGNVFSTFATGISAINNARLTVKGNFFGTDATQTFALGSKSTAFAISGNSAATGVIGGTAAEDQNVFANYDNPFSLAGNAYLKVTKNTFYCNTKVVLPQGNAAMVNNYIRIIKLENNSISGEAPAGAVVQLYYTDNSRCSDCNPTTWFAQVTVSASGTWTYNGALASNVMVSSTLGDYTVGFEPYGIEEGDVIVTDVNCNHAGSLELKTKREGNFQFAWRDANGNLKSSTQKADGLTAGVYTLEVTSPGGCPAAKGQFTIKDLTPQIAPQTYPTDCNNPTGRFTITDNVAGGIAAYKWTDAANKVVGSSATITGLVPGDYYLVVTDNSGCSSSPVKFQVLAPQNQPVLDESNVQPQPTPCGANTGSVTGLKLPGAATGAYGWSTADGSKTYPNQLNLTNVPSGDYYFYYNYAGSCTVKSNTYRVTEINNITIDDSQKSIQNADCGSSTGSITAIKAPGATIYQWKTATGSVVGNMLNLTGVAAGSYYLEAGNSAGCKTISSTYTIGGAANLINIGSITPVVKNATCGQNNGSIDVQLTNVVKVPKSYRWQTASGQPVGPDGLVLPGLDAGSYSLYGIDDNGCEKLLTTRTITRIAEMQFASTPTTTDDHCDLSTGSVSGVQITGGLAPYSYTWLNANGQQAGAQVNLTAVKAGLYTLHVKDASGCELISADYPVQNITQIIASPQLNNVQICTPGTALLQVANPAGGYKYRVYDSQSSLTPVSEQTGGTLKVAVNTNRSFYVSASTGSCESSRTEVKVSVGLSAIGMANTFSPNGDGMNDTWVLKGMENYPAALVQIFNRYGQKVYESRGYSVPFNGIVNGVLLPAGAYYYIINLGSSCSLLSGTLTLMR